MKIAHIQLLIVLLCVFVTAAMAHADDKYWMQFVYGQPKQCKDNQWSPYHRDKLTQDALDYRYNPNGKPTYSEFGILNGYTDRNPNGTGLYFHNLQGGVAGFYNYSNP